MQGLRGSVRVLYMHHCFICGRRYFPPPTRNTCLLPTLTPAIPPPLLRPIRLAHLSIAIHVSHCSIPMCTFGFVVKVVGRVDGPVFSFADELDDGALVVLAAVDEPLHHADDDDDEEGDDAVV